VVIQFTDIGGQILVFRAPRGAERHANHNVSVKRHTSPRIASYTTTLLSKPAAPTLVTMPARCKDRERILASGVVDVPALPLGAVRGILCFRCFAPTKNLQKCGACRRVGYCSKECQKLDWTAVHKKQCKLLQQVNEIDSGEQYKDSRSWADYRRVQVIPC